MQEWPGSLLGASGAGKSTTLNILGAMENNDKVALAVAFSTTLGGIMAIVKLAMGLWTMSVLFIVGCANGFGYIITIAQLPQKMIALFSNFITNRYTALLLINLFLLVVGMLMESLSALTLLTPILVPIAMSYGIDPIHFGIVMILNLMIGMLTPPVGMVLFVLSRMTPTPFEKICKAMVPFLGMCIIALIIIALVPPLVTFLPGVLM